MRTELEEITPMEVAAANARVGMDQAAESAGEDWVRYAEQFAENYAKTHPFVFVDDLWEAGLNSPAQMKALGPAMARLFRKGVLAKVPIAGLPGAFAARASVRSNGQVKLVWRSRLYQGETPWPPEGRMIAEMSAILQGVRSTLPEWAGPWADRLLAEAGRKEGLEA